jgi:hypothetical protein
MASRRRRTFPPAYTRHKLRRTRPLAEDVEGRIVLSQVVPPNIAALGPDASLMPRDGLVPSVLSTGHIALLSMPGAAGILASDAGVAVDSTTYDLTSLGS